MKFQLICVQECGNIAVDWTRGVVDPPLRWPGRLKAELSAFLPRGTINSRPLKPWRPPTKPLLVGESRLSPESKSVSCRNTSFNFCI